MGVKSMRTLAVGVLGTMAAGAVIYAAAPHSVGINTNTPVAQTTLGGIPVRQTPVRQTPVRQTPVRQTPEKTFFQSITGPRVEITLAPDPMVQKSMPDIRASRAKVEVYLPIYPGAKQVAQRPQIGDMGTPMSADLLDGTLYFSSSEGAAKIENWYKQQFAKLGYTIDGSGSSGRYGKTTSTFVSFSKKGQLGNPTPFPQVDLGFATGGSTTVFKLKVDYIALPSRPANTLLPKNVVKVILSGGAQSFTVTDSRWIQTVIQQLNALSVASPGITNCPAIGTAAGVKPKYQGVVQAQFVLQNGKTIPVLFSIPCGVRDVTVDHSQVTLQGNAKLDREINAVTGFAG